MPKKVILVTGSKGGGGKTPIATALTLAYSELGYTVLAADFNFNNSDLYSILIGTNLGYQQATSRSRPISPTASFEIWNITETLSISKWEKTTKLGLPSTEDLWTRIEAYANELGDQYDIIIVDTNLTLPLLCPPLTSLQQWNLPPLEVWHIWSPSIVLQVGEQERFDQAIDILKRFSPGFEERLHHVFTPRFYVPSQMRKLIQGWATGHFGITRRQYKKFKGTAPKPVLFSDIRDALFASYLLQLFNFGQEGSVEELMKEWLENIFDTLQERSNPPSNVVLIPSVIAELALFVERLVLKPQRTDDLLRGELGKVYVIVKAHVERQLQDDPL